ncbi:MAG: hypothetical protein JWQ09_3750 [Segetibacter sp.]|nr:hypothetical protein [Segetibacter sp.]
MYHSINTKIWVETVNPFILSYDVYEQLAEANQLLAKIHLLRKNEQNDIYLKMIHYFSDSGWTVEEFKEQKEDEQE